MRKSTAAVFAAVCLAGSVHAENAACWGDNAREDITCVQITEPMLMGLRGQTMAGVRKVMKAPGVERQAGGLHYLSNFSNGSRTGSGTVNVLFEDGRATFVNASIDTPGKVGEFAFTWAAYAAPALGYEIDRSTKSFTRQPYCSDLSGPDTCRGRNMDGELTLSQMQFGLSRADVLKMLDGACNPGPGLAVSDPNGDCARLRKRFR